MEAGGDGFLSGRGGEVAGSVLLVALVGVCGAMVSGRLGCSTRLFSDSSPCSSSFPLTAPFEKVARGPLFKCLRGTRRFGNGDRISRVVSILGGVPRSVVELYTETLICEWEGCVQGS